MFVDLMTQRTTRRPFSIDSSMEVIEFRNLQKVERQKIINLMSNENVSRYLPLMTGTFSSKSCDRFLQEKAKLWEKHGYGPWAIFIHDEFAGWGGLQLENDEVEFALVLHPEYWGWGKRIFDKTLAWDLVRKVWFRSKVRNSESIDLTRLIFPLTTNANRFPIPLDVVPL